MTLTAMACQANMLDSSGELARLNEDYAAILEWQDIVVRALHNPKMSAHYFRLFVAFIDDHPELLQEVGLRKEIEVISIREHAGDMAEKTAGRFFKDLAEIGAIKYETPFDKELGKRRSFVTSLSSLSYPESFDTNTPSRKRRAKEAEEKAEKQFKDPRKLWFCEVCGGDLFYDATPHCKSCGHVHATIKDIPAAEITIEAEVHEIAEGDDAWLNEWDTPTIEVQAVRPGAIQQQQLPETPRPAPASVGKHPRGIACPDCHSLNHWKAVPTTYRDEPIYVCAICYPD